ncbi:NAD(+) synthase [Candidatus Roizmanbacteria bacterium]|nr:NAD(+) synthase [Candidatus Roizmanbacteria bacterium]
MNDLLKIDLEQEKERIVAFLKSTFETQKINHAVIGLSGGIDSMTSFFLLKEVLPPENIIVAHLYYFNSVFAEIEEAVLQSSILKKNIYHLSIKEPVDAVLHLQKIENNEENKIRVGNIAARMRMIFLFDLAKKVNGLVCGTENKSESLLGYFTRFGDQASDIEPIEHLYKTQVLNLAKFLGIPYKFITKDPTAGLWHGQTDEGEFGFSYAEADQVLYLHLEQNKSIEELETMGFKNTQKILERWKKNLFKHNVPYVLK